MSDHDEKRSLLAQLIKLAKSDNELKESEFRFLFSIAEQINFPLEEFKTLFDENIDFTPPKMEMDRIVQFHRLVLLMNVDQNIDEGELKVVQTMGMRMGLNPMAIAEVLDIMHNYPNNMIDPPKLLSIFKTFHN